MTYYFILGGLRYRHILLFSMVSTALTCCFVFALLSYTIQYAVQYYTENGGKPVYVLLLDTSKAFDKVAFNVLFNKLRDRSMCPRITKLLHHMYTNQSCYVKWGNEHSDSFNVSNGVKQGGVISPLLLVVISINFFHN